MRFSDGVPALLVTACWLLTAQSYSKPDPPSVVKLATPTEKLTYEVEWRLIRAGTAVVESQKSHTQLKLESAGMVSALFKVNDTYSVSYEDPFCATGSLMDSLEGRRHRETKVTFDRSRNHATFLERDVIKNTVIRTNEIDVPNCVHEVVGALLELRAIPIEPGQSTQLPVSDGRRSAPVKIEAQEREEVKTSTGTHKTIRYEAYLLNGVIYPRKGRVFVWLTDDARRLPVQIRLRMQFPIGTVTLRLQKEEHS